MPEGWLRAAHHAWLAAALIVFVAIIRAAAQELPPALAARFAEGVAELEAGHAADAEAAFRDVLRQGGRKAPVHHNLGIALQQRGRHAEALAEFRAASRLDPAHGSSRLLAATSLAALGRLKEARADLDRAVGLMPNELVAHTQLADVCRHLDDELCEVDAYRQAVRLVPSDPEYAYRLGDAYLRLSERAHARISAIDPNSARLHQALGREYLRQSRPDLARKALEDAVRADPRLPEIHLALARLHIDEGRWDDASREVEAELALVPESRDARLLKAQIDAARRPR